MSPAPKTKAEDPANAGTRRYEINIRPEFVDNLCNALSRDLKGPASQPKGRIPMTLDLDPVLANYYHLESCRLRRLGQKGERFPSRETAHGLIVNAISGRLPELGMYQGLVQLAAWRRVAFGVHQTTARLLPEEKAALEALSSQLPAPSGVGFLKPKAIAEALVLASALGNEENPMASQIPGPVEGKGKKRG